MTGVVSVHRALLVVSSRAPGDDTSSLRDTEFVIDTGFVGYLALPPALVALLDLPFRRNSIARLADNSEIEVDVYGAEIVWQGVFRRVEVLATGDTPLLGTRLLDGCELNIRFADDDAVTVSLL